MYKHFFGLRESPFNVNPDPRFLYLTPQTQESLDTLTYGIQKRKGFILLTGEAGTGKTTLINYLLDWLRQRRMPTAFIFNSHLSVNHLFDFILSDFGIPVDFRLTGNMLLQLNTWLIDRFRAGKTPVLIVDEAQGLSFELLEEIRLLLNLETASEKLLQIVLVGQPELEEKLKRPALRQLQQRIALRCNTAPLTLEESRAYIMDRLRIGGATGDPLFAADAMEAVHFYSRGIPRVMNLLCEHALINAYVEQLNPVTAQMVEEAAQEFLLDEVRPVKTRLSVADNMNSNLTIMQSMDTRKWAGPATREQAIVPASPHIRWDVSAAAQAVEETTLTAENSYVTRVENNGENAAPAKNLNASFSMDEWSPSLPTVAPEQREVQFSLDSFAHDPDPAAELVAAMKRILEPASEIPLPSRVSQSRGCESPSVAKNTRVFASGNLAVSLDTRNRIPRHVRGSWVRARSSFSTSWGTLCGTVFVLGTVAVRWAHVVGERIELTIYPDLPLKRWICEFKSDWISLMKGLGCAQMKASLLHWLREPISSKPMTSSKD